jgi:pyrroloquinoline quinone biosynthesis protein E
VVGAALLSLTAAAAVLNAFADLLDAWLAGGPPPGGRPPRARPEADGEALLAWSDPPALLHLDAPTAAAAWARGVAAVSAAPVPAGALAAPTEAHLAVTARCPVACTGCYLDAGPGQPAPADPGGLPEALDALGAAGAFEVAFGGGEGALRDDLPALAARARQAGLVPNLTTSGFGLSPARAARLAAACGQINVSIDGLGPVYEAARGWDGAGLGLSAVQRLKAAGARVGVNTVLSRPLLESPGALEALGAALSAAGVDEWQWLRYKPVGRGAGAADALAPAGPALDGLFPRALALEAAGAPTIRFDCALVPFLVHGGADLGALALLGVRGCPAAHSLVARDAAGAWAGCSFLAGQAAPAGADLPDWSTHPALRAARAWAEARPRPCADCPARAICRGGCRAVSAARTGDPAAPDPDCPRVRAWAAGSA